MNSSYNVQYDVGEQNDVTFDISVVDYNIQHDIDMASETCHMLWTQHVIHNV